MKELDRLNPKIIVALGRQANEALYDLADAYMPHPDAVHRYKDTGEVARKIKKIMAKVKAGSANDGIDTRSDIAAREYERTWQTMYPRSGRGGLFYRPIGEDSARMNSVCPMRSFLKLITRCTAI